MAKDLPYFKFIISEWNDGDITLCSMEAQGLFINLCSVYWSQEGDLSITKAKRRYNGCNTTVWDELINDRIIKIDGDNIIINFLDEQFRERDKLSKTNSKNVSKRWKKDGKNTTVVRPYNDRKGSVYNKEEKREEKKREEEKIKEVVHKNFSIDNYQTGSEAFEEIKNDELMVNKLLRVVRLEGYQTCDELTVMKATRHFFAIEEAKPDFLHKPRDEHKKYLVNWLRSHALTLTKYG